MQLCDKNVFCIVYKLSTFGKIFISSFQYLLNIYICISTYFKQRLSSACPIIYSKDVLSDLLLIKNKFVLSNYSLIFFSSFPILIYSQILLLNFFRFGLKQERVS